jgi:hypothetical protein
MNPTELAAAVNTAPESGLFAAAAAHPLIAMLVAVLILVLLLIAFRIVVRIFLSLKNRQESDSLKKDLMVWSVLSSLVHGGKKTDKAKAELNTKLKIIDRTFAHASDILKAQKHLSSRRPWFAVLGEPACGKSKLIENSELDYRCTEREDRQKPPLKFYYNQNSVLADISGRVFFDNWLGGSSAEWNHICNLFLKKNRKKPVSGVILTISAEALLADDRKLTQKKAALMAGELLRLTGTVRMSLPCFVVVTKLDTVVGFREYFAALDDKAKNQITGFQPLTDKGVFDQDDFEEFFDRFISRLSDGACGLMTGKQVLELAYADKSRMALAGGIYLFPPNLAKIQNNLEVYLDALFGSRSASAEGGARFKGVFFTSAEDKGLSLNERFAALQSKGIDDAPVRDPNFKASRSYFISELLSRLVLPAAATAQFTRQEQLRRRMPAFALCAALLALSGIYWYATIFKGPELNARLHADMLYYQGVGHLFASGDIDAAPLLGVDNRGEGVLLLNSPMPNDSRITRAGFFSEAQRRLLSRISIPWQFFPGSLFSFGLDQDTDIAGRNFVYNQVQTKMAFLPAIEALEYNFITQGKEPYTRKKRDALFELMQIALFRERNQSEVNDEYSPSTMGAFLDYLYPQAGDSVKKQLTAFRPGYDYLAAATNSQIVLSENYADSCREALKGFTDNWKKLQNYPEEEYAVLRKDISSASKLIDIYEELSELQATDFTQLEPDEMQRILDRARQSAEEYANSLGEVDNMVKLAGVMQDVTPASSKLPGKTGADGKEKDEKANNRYPTAFEKAYVAYRKLLGQDYGFLEDFDRERRSAQPEDAGDTYGGLDLQPLIAERRVIEERLDAEHQKLSQTIVSVQQSPLFDLVDPQSPSGGYNYGLCGQMLKAAIMDLPEIRVSSPDQIAAFAAQINDEYAASSGELSHAAAAGEKSAVIKTWDTLCKKLMSARFNLAMIRLGQQALALYPDSVSDLNLLSDLTMLVADSGKTLADFSPAISSEMMGEVLGRFEFRQEYNPAGFMEYSAPLAKFSAITKAGKEGGNELYARRLSSNEKFKRLTRVFSKYAGSYINYWGHLADSLHLQADSYAEFYAKASDYKAYQINSQLQDLYTLSFDAVSKLDDALLDDNVKSQKTATLKLLDQRIKGIDISFTDECNEVLTAWSLLSADATYANRKVMHMSDRELRSSLLSLGKGVLPWWSEFTSLGTKLLKRDASTEATMSLAMYQSRLKFFPLVKDGDVHSKVLSKTDLKRLMVMFSTFGLTDASKTEAPDELAGFDKDPDQVLKVSDDLKGPLVFSDDSGKQADFKIWASTMEKLLTALSSDEKNMQFVITRIDAAAQNRLAAEQGLGGYESSIARYRYFDVKVGKKHASQRVSSFVSKPDEAGMAGGVINNDEIVFNFYRFSDSDTPDCTYKLDGAYPSLQLYLSKRGVYDEESRQVTLPLRLKDTNGSVSVFYVGIKLKAGLPLPSDWPSLADWPDVSLFKDFSR